jgi:hypothetical protein
MCILQQGDDSEEMHRASTQHKKVPDAVKEFYFVFQEKESAACVQHTTKY